MIRVVLLTGFLGAGKTTLLQRILRCYADRRIGVVVNEFGAVDVDAVTLAREGVAIECLSNGSIFCACLKENFLTALIRISERDLEYLFIEASGLSDPASIGTILDTIAPKATHPYHYEGAICLVDADSFLDLVDVLPALERQVRYSDAVIVNRADLATPDAVKGTVAKVREISPACAVHVTTHAAVDAVALVEDLADAGHAAEDSSNTEESRPTTFTLRVTAPLDPDALAEFLAAVASGAYRIKGFVETTAGPVAVNAVGPRVDIQPWPEPVEGGHLVVISAKGIRLLNSLTNQINAHFKGQIAL